MFGKVNPLANLMNNLAVIFSPMFMNDTKAHSQPETAPCFIFLPITDVMLPFKPSRVKKYDDKYRAAAGKPLSEALAGRK